MELLNATMDIVASLWSIGMLCAMVRLMVGRAEAGVNLIHAGEDPEAARKLAAALLARALELEEEAA